jgi:hypothetical protein
VQQVSEVFGLWRHITHCRLSLRKTGLQASQSRPALSFSSERKKFPSEKMNLPSEEKKPHALNLPKISAGYMSERVSTERFRGITGLSLPWWENKNTVRKIAELMQWN